MEGTIGKTAILFPPPSTGNRGREGRAPAGLATAGALPPPPLFPSRKEGEEGRFALGPLPFFLFLKESLLLSSPLAKEALPFILFQN